MNKNDFSLESQTDWERLAGMTEDEIDFSDIPELTAEQLATMKPTKQFFAERGIVDDAQTVESITVHHDDGSTTRYHAAPQGGLILLDPDVQKYFPDSATVNRTLRALIDLVPQ